MGLGQWLAIVKSQIRNRQVTTRIGSEGKFLHRKRKVLVETIAQLRMMVQEKRVDADIEIAFQTFNLVRCPFLLGKKRDYDRISIHSCFCFKYYKPIEN